MPTLDELLSGYQDAAPDPLVQFRTMFADDFGDLTGGDFVMNGSLPAWNTTVGNTPVEVRGQTAPSGAREYVVNGSRLTLPSDFPRLNLEERRAVLLEAIRRYV